MASKEQVTSVLTDFANWLDDNGQVKGKSVHCRGSKYTPDDYSKFMKNFLDSGEPEMRAMFELGLSLGSKVFKKGVADFISRNNAQHQIDKQESSPLSRQIEYIRKNCVYVNAIEGEGDHYDFFLDKTTLERHPMTLSAIKKHLPHPPDKNWRELIQDNMIDAKTEYTPFTLNSLEDIECAASEVVASQEVVSLTSYCMPKWRRQYLNGSVAELNSLWLEFLEFLVPNDESREKLLWWAYKSLNDIVLQHLILVGPQGIGKGLFVDYLLRGLHGEDNFDHGKSDTLTGRFNSVMANKTLVYLDEIAARSPKEHDTLKRWANPILSLEAKHRDAQKWKRTASLILSSNYYHTIFIDADTDRKFLVPDLNSEHKQLNEHWSQAKINELIESLENSEDQLGFYLWLENKFRNDPDDYKVFEGLTFNRMLLETAQAPVQFCIEQVTDGEKSQYSLKELKKQFSRDKKRSDAGAIRMHPDYLEGFFKKLKINGKHIAKVDRDKWLLIPINDYARDGSDL